MPRSYRLDYLKAEQISELTEHLSEVLSDQELDRAVVTLDHAVASARPHSDPRWQRDWENFENATIRHLLAVEKQATELRRRLDELKANHVQIVFGRINEPEFEWPRFLEALERVREGANYGARRYKKRGRGRPVLKWRDELIATAFSIYPAGKAELAAESHFERTVEILLSFLGTSTIKTEVEALHAVIAEARDRHPAVPSPLSANMRAFLALR